MSITSLAVVLFAIPLGVAIGRLDRSQQVAKLQTDATRIAALVPDNPLRGGQPLPPGVATDSISGIYSPTGHRAGGRGPTLSAIAGSARDGRTHSGSEGGQLVVSVPVPSDKQVVAVIRSAVPLSLVSSRTHRSWALMAVLGMAVLAVAGALAARQARRIALPLERLTDAARALGDGNFAVSPPLSGIREADVAAVAIGETAARLGQLLERERTFSADASHQLRTPLTGLLLGLESAIARPDADRDRALRDAVDRGRQLEVTIEDLLKVRRDASRGVGCVDAGAVLTVLVDRWRPLLAAKSRELVTAEGPQLPPVKASEAALRQALDVLVDNAMKHGRGTVTITVRELEDAVAIEVTDEGEGVDGDPETAFDRGARSGPGHGIGLALARSLVEAGGGRLLLKRAAPYPEFVILLPLGESVIATGVHASGPGTGSSS